MSHMTNPLATPEQLYKRRTIGSLPLELQDAIFFSTQCLTQAAGILLQLPQSITAQANVLLARYWLIDPMMSHEFAEVSAAAIFLVAKIGPSPRAPRDISNVYAYLLSSSSAFFKPSSDSPPENNPESYYRSESDYQSFHSRILAIEGRIFYALGFDTHISLPHPLAITYLQALDFLNFDKEILAKRTLEYLNTALLSPQMLYCTCQPNALAVAAIYNAAKDVGAKMPDNEWWEVFDVDREELGFLVMGMRSVEGWVKKMREEDMPKMKEGMITRKDVQEVLASKGIKIAGVSAPVEEDPEAAMARKMDEKMDEMETT
ncbi:cyclin-L2 [Podospora fimiseda]|uniref:Cyclin-L2 n=1 Tax=Podospora fimiseda TaxID=252190 RepID=A0AAN7GXS5_9PEZI|nr:cyclin-L2 [Podospora fimiseda]